MYPQRENKTDLTFRSAREYSRAANFVSDFEEATGVVRKPRRENWINGRVRTVLWADTDGSVDISVIDNVGASTLVQTLTWTVALPGTIEKFEFFATSEIFDVKGTDSVIEVDGAHKSLRFQYFPRFRQ